MMNRYAHWMIGWLLMVVVNAAEIGDVGAPLRVGEWVKGGPVTLAEGKGKSVFVVEFWATWCPPCRQSIPHLSELQAKFKDKGVVVIGITDEKTKTVKAFVGKMGGKMEYAVGIDEGGKTSKAYLDAYQQDGIPTAFVIDKTGAVVWVGHPLEGLDQVVEQVVAGTYKPKSAAELAAEDEPDKGDALMEEYFDAASRRSGKVAASEVGEKVMKEVAGDATKLNEFAWQILTDEMLIDHDYPLALRAARRAFELTQGKEFAIVDTYARALFMTGTPKEAIAMQEQAVKLCDHSKQRLELKETLEDYLHPAPDRGQGDEQLVEHFINEALALVKSKQAVPLDQLFTKTDIKPHKVELPPASTQALASEDLYERGRQSVLTVGTLNPNDAGDWDVALATGFVIHESGIFVTNFHVLDEPSAAVLAAMTADGHVYPVKSVLAVAPFADIAICQLAGVSGLKPLPLVANAKPGSHVRILSHPNNAFYSLTEGILSRYAVYRANGKSTSVLTTTAEFAVGSSGGPLFDNCGNIIGMVASTSSVYSGPDESPGDAATNDAAGMGADYGDLQMVVKMCVPSAEILKLLGAGE